MAETTQALERRREKAAIIAARRDRMRAQFLEQKQKQEQQQGPTAEGGQPVLTYTSFVAANWANGSAGDEINATVSGVGKPDTVSGTEHLQNPTGDRLDENLVAQKEAQQQFEGQRLQKEALKDHAERTVQHLDDNLRDEVGGTQAYNLNQEIQHSAENSNVGHATRRARKEMNEDSQDHLNADERRAIDRMESIKSEAESTKDPDKAKRLNAELRDAARDVDVNAGKENKDSLAVKGLKLGVEVSVPGSGLATEAAVMAVGPAVKLAQSSNSGDSSVKKAGNAAENAIENLEKRTTPMMPQRGNSR